jgi:hypothetical protein
MHYVTNAFNKVYNTLLGIHTKRLGGLFLKKEAVI